MACKLCCSSACGVTGVWLAVCVVVAACVDVDAIGSATDLDVDVVTPQALKSKVRSRIPLNSKEVKILFIAYLL